MALPVYDEKSFPAKFTGKCELQSSIIRNYDGVKRTYNTGKYIGEFVNGEKNGQGEYLWPKGQSYSGNWVNGKLTGRGEYHRMNGNYYIGEWKENKRHGQGEEYKVTKNEKYTGNWDDNKFVSGRIYKDGKIQADGEFFDYKLTKGVRYHYLSNGSFIMFDHNDKQIIDSTIIANMEDKMDSLTEMVNKSQEQIDHLTERLDKALNRIEELERTRV